MKFKKGFTLIEIVVVIAIMGILTVIIIPSLNSARSRNRDMERVADIGTIQLGLLNYYAKYGSYPTELDPASTTINQYIVESAFVDPDGSFYDYVSLKRSGTKCTYFHLGATLESQIGQIDKTDTFSSVPESISNGYSYCDSSYSGPGIAAPDLINTPPVYNYNIRP
jgi:prepilin-type N-terminal cleavage/methylation domain-containing protein